MSSSVGNRLQNNRSRLRLAAILYFVTRVALAVATGGVLVFYLLHGQVPPGVMGGVAGGMALLLAGYYAAAAGQRCGVCGNPVLMNSGEPKHPAARRLWFLSRRARVAWELLWRGNYKCMYCHAAGGVVPGHGVNAGAGALFPAASTPGTPGGFTPRSLFAESPDVAFPSSHGKGADFSEVPPVEAPAPGAPANGPEILPWAANFQSPHQVHPHAMNQPSHDQPAAARPGAFPGTSVPFPPGPLLPHVSGLSHPPPAGFRPPVFGVAGGDPAAEETKHAPSGMPQSAPQGGISPEMVTSPLDLCRDLLKIMEESHRALTDSFRQMIGKLEARMAASLPPEPAAPPAGGGAFIHQGRAGQEEPGFSGLGQPVSSPLSGHAPEPPRWKLTRPDELTAGLLSTALSEAFQGKAAPPPPDIAEHRSSVTDSPGGQSGAMDREDFDFPEVPATGFPPPFAAFPSRNHSPVPPVEILQPYGDGDGDDLLTPPPPGPPAPAPFTFLKRNGDHFAPDVEASSASDTLDDIVLPWMQPVRNRH